MKRVFLSLTMIAALTLTSCKEEAKKDAADETKTEEVAATDEKSEETPAESTDGAPSFSDSDVQAYVDSYESYIADYKKAVESKDMTAFADLGKKGQDLATKAQEVTGKITGADAEKLTTYMTAKAEELQELTKKMMQ